MSGSMVMSDGIVSEVVSGGVVGVGDLSGVPMERLEAGGELSYSKVRAMTRVATPAIEAELVEIAREQTGAGLERICRAYRRCGELGADDDALRVFEERALSWCHGEDGAFVFHGRLPAELGELVIQMIERARADLAAARGGAAVSESSAEGAGAGPRRRREPRESPAAERADALVHAARGFLGLLDEGRRRVAPAEVTVLVDADLYLDAHHLVHWIDEGPTDLENLVLLCAFHHRRLHEGGWALTRDASGRFYAHDPSGQRYDTVSVRIDPSDRLERIHERLGLHLNARTNESLWEGPGGDLSAIIEYLAHLDHHNPPATG